MTGKRARRSIRRFSVELHGGGWRARVPEQTTGRLVTVALGCESGEDATAAGWKYLSDITEGTWRDPQRGAMLLRTYIDKRWWPAQRLALNTKAQYRSLLIHHILPTFGTGRWRRSLRRKRSRRGRSPCMNTRSRREVRRCR